MRLPAFLIALSALAVPAFAGPAAARSVAVRGNVLVLPPPSAAAPLPLPHPPRFAGPVVPPLAPVIVVPPTIVAPHGVVEQPIVIRQGHRLFLVAPGVFVPLR